MNDLERRALLGDAEAQRECTENGIVLRCPFCGNEPIIEDNRVFCGVCGLAYEELDAGLSLRAWNTRPAPPIGRCGECGAYTSEGPGLGCCSDGTGKTDDGYCDCFYPKGGEENAVD